METRYYIHKSPWEKFSNLSVVRGKYTKVVFTSIYAEEVALFGTTSGDTRIRVSPAYLFEKLEDALGEFRLVLADQVAEMEKEVELVKTFLGMVTW